MLLEEIDEDVALAGELGVGDEGADLGHEVGRGARQEGLVRESVVKGEKELSGSAILELRHELDASVLQVGHHLTRVVHTTFVLIRIESGCNLVCSCVARNVASSGVVSLIVLEGETAAEVSVTESSANSGGKA